MWEIRPEQLRVFELRQEREFRQRLLRILRAVFDPDPIREELVADAIAAARRYGLRSERAIADFVGLVVQHGCDFDRQDAVRHVLEDRSIDPEERLRILLIRMNDPRWPERKNWSG